MAGWHAFPILHLTNFFSRDLTMTTKYSSLSCSLVAILASAALLSGCGPDSHLQTGQIVGGATKQVTAVQPVGGFLPDASLLAPGDSGQMALVYWNPAVTLTSYHSIILDPVAIWSGPDSPISKMPADQKLALANDFTVTLTKTLKKKCNLAGEPGPGVAHVSLALVDATTTNAAVTTVATYTPYLSPAYALSSMAFNHGVSFFGGSATIEGVAVDSVDKSVIWEGVDKRAGTTSMLKNTFNNELDAENAFKTWSNKFLKTLTQRGICTS